MEIEPADARIRRLAIMAVVAAGLLGAAGIAMLKEWLDGLASARGAVGHEAQEALRTAFMFVITIACASLLVLASYLWRLATSVRRSGRYPPPGMRVLRDTAIARGRDASRHARLLQLFAGLLVLCGGGLAAAAWRLLAQLGDHAL